MTRIVRMKNTTGSPIQFVGQTIAAGEYLSLAASDYHRWVQDSTVFSAIGDGTLIVNSGADVIGDITDVTEAWQWLSSGEMLPKSSIDGKKLAVHMSFKPDVSGITTHAVWTGSGDDPDTPSDINGGDLLHFSCIPGSATTVIDVKFNIGNGRVWIHEGYLKYNNAGLGDFMNGDIIAEATPLQTSANLDLELDGDLIKYATGGEGTGTHGWADGNKIQLLPRTYTKDGYWDFDGSSLVPNISGEGGYNISNIEQIVHRYFNKIPCFDTCSTFFSMTSEETTEVLPNYFMRITAYNNSDTVWDASIIMELYREKTV